MSARTTNNKEIAEKSLALYVMYCLVSPSDLPIRVPNRISVISLALMANWIAYLMFPNFTAYPNWVLAPVSGKGCQDPSMCQKARWGWLSVWQHPDFSTVDQQQPELYNRMWRDLSSGIYCHQSRTIRPPSRLAWRRPTPEQTMCG